MQRITISLYSQLFAVSCQLSAVSRRLSSVSYFLLFSAILFSFQTGAQPEHLKVQVKKPITALGLLERYHLDAYDCNLEEFLKLNHLKEASDLKRGADYTLPIKVYAYNGQSIRSSTGVVDLDAAKKIQSYNVEMLEAKVKRASYQSNKLIWFPYHILNCKGEAKKKKKGEDLSDIAGAEGSETPKRSRTYAIFGKKYEHVPLVDKKLKGKIFYVESGHGGPDPGAQYKLNGRTLCEDEYAYDVSLRVARDIISHGGTVFIINRDPDDGIRDGDYLLCDTDELTYPNLKPPVNHKERLFQRSDAVNALYDKYKKLGVKDQRLIVIHVDSRIKTQQTDVFLYYQSDNAESKRIATAMHSTLVKKYARFRDYLGTLTTRDLHMLREVKATTVYVELGNIRNSFDLKRLMPSKNRQAIANWLYEGFVK